MKFRRVISLILVAGFLIAIPVANGNLDWKNWGKGAVFASTSGRDQAKDELDDLEDEMDELEAHFADLEDQLSDKAKELSDLLMDQEILENDIKATQEAIDQAEKDLVVAKEKEAQEYEAMNLRIQYMY